MVFALLMCRVRKGSNPFQVDIKRLQGDDIITQKDVKIIMLLTNGYGMNVDGYRKL